MLVDTATDLRQQALTHRLSRVDAILFTHSHADHMMGLDEVRRFNVLQRGAIPAYADARTVAELRRTFNYVFDPPAQKGGGVPQIELHTIDGPFAVGGVAMSSRAHSSRRRGRFSAFVSARSPISPTATAFPTSRGRCSRDSTCSCSTRCAIGRIRRTSPWPKRSRSSTRLARAQTLLHAHLPRPAARGHQRALPPGVELAYDGLIDSSVAPNARCAHAAAFAPDRRTRAAYARPLAPLDARTLTSDSALGPELRHLGPRADFGCTSTSHLGLI